MTSKSFKDIWGDPDIKVKETFQDDDGEPCIVIVLTDGTELWPRDKFYLEWLSCYDYNPNSIILNEFKQSKRIIEMAHTKELLPPGPWIEDIEKYPNQLYSFDYEGYKCEIKRQDGWYWTGYVYLQSTHPDYNKHCTEIDVGVHGGLTYSSEGKIGFDCAHLHMDIDPSHLVYRQQQNLKLYSKSTFKDYEYVKKEVESLAKQLKEKE